MNFFFILLYLFSPFMISEPASVTIRSTICWLQERRQPESPAHTTMARANTLCTRTRHCCIKYQPSTELWNNLPAHIIMETAIIILCTRYSKVIESTMLQSVSLCTSQGETIKKCTSPIHDFIIYLISYSIQPSTEKL